MWAIVKIQSYRFATDDIYEVAEMDGPKYYGIRHLDAGEKTFGIFENQNKAITACLRLNQIAEIMRS